MPIFGVAGWPKDGKGVLLYDKYDIWNAPLDGGKAVNVTQGVGRRDEIQFRLVRFPAAGRGRRGPGGGGGRGRAAAAATDGVDMTQPMNLSAYGTRSKKTGYWKVTP